MAIHMSLIANTNGRNTSAAILATSIVRVIVRITLVVVEDVQTG